MASIGENQIKALIKLLSDENARVARMVKEKLVEIGDPAIPFLLEAESRQPVMAQRIEAVLDEIRGSRLEEELRQLSNREYQGIELDLEQGAFLIARYAYPALDVGAYVRRLDAMAEAVWDRMGTRGSADQAVKTLGRYLFGEQGFRGNSKHYYDPDNSYLNRVIDRRTGIPISLSVLYLLIGRRLDLPVYGVGMPGHFLVKFEGERHPIFVDCFNGGAVLTEQDCQRFLCQAGYGFDEQYLARSSHRAILIRMLKNLIVVYDRMNEPIKRDRFIQFLGILSEGEPAEP
jgi:regulator of sirC expression with transglutaminase-like and TPR domain